MATHRKIILDSPAFISIIDKTATIENIEKVISVSIMSAVEVAEVLHFLVTQKGYTVEEAKDIIEQLLSEIVPFTAEQAYLTAGLQLPADIPLSVQACLALSILTGAPIYTGCASLSQLTGFEIKLIK